MDERFRNRLHTSVRSATPERGKKSHRRQGVMNGRVWGCRGVRMRSAFPWRRRQFGRPLMCPAPTAHRRNGLRRFCMCAALGAFPPIAWYSETRMICTFSPIVRISSAWGEEVSSITACAAQPEGKQPGRLCVFGALLQTGLCG